VLDRTGVAALALVAAQAAWFAAGFVFPALPGWTMFAKVEPARARLIDASGQAVEVHDLIPRDVYLIDRSGARAIASWECRAKPERGPWRLKWADGTEENPCP
jgi:hypothetical protein